MMTQPDNIVSNNNFFLIQSEITCFGIPYGSIGSDRIVSVRLNEMHDSKYHCQKPKTTTKHEAQKREK